jgi:imidazolonepropionase-like amidohydrolase
VETYLLGVTLIDCTGREPLHDSVIATEGNLIVRIGTREELQTPAGQEANVIDLTGKTVMPGLINMHDHLLFKYASGPWSEHMKKSLTWLILFAIKTVLGTLRSGITTIRDMASFHGIVLALRDSVSSGEILGPRILTCNQPLCATGGHGLEICFETDGPDNVRQAARTQLKLGADFVKVMASHDPFPMPGYEQTRSEFTIEEMKAAVEEAHKWGRFAACHAMGKKALMNSIEAGVDIVDHGAYLDKDMAKLMVERGTYLTPTLSAYTKQTMNPRFNRGEKWASDHKPLIEPITKAFQIALEEGVRIVCGTDSTGRYAEEVELMREYGMDAMQSLQACTKTAAKALGLGESLGTVEVGKIADLVVMEGNPLTDPYALERVQIVIKEGSVYRPEDIRL